MRRFQIKCWIIALLLALPSVVWPLVEQWKGYGSSSIFLPFLNQVDVAYPLSWMSRIAKDSNVTDLSVWEHRHDMGSPSSLVSWWPRCMGFWIHLYGSPTIYWFIVYLCHVIWIYISYQFISRFLENKSVAWWIASLFVYFSFLIGINVFYQGLHVERWSMMFVYENFRAYPSVISLLFSTLAVWRLHAAHQQASLRNFVLAGVCVAITPYGRPFDWMILTTFIGLMGLYSYFKSPDDEWRRWVVVMIVNLFGTLPFLVRYILWMSGDPSIYEDSLARGVLQGKEWFHFFKYGVMASLFCLLIWLWLRPLHRNSRSYSCWKLEDLRFFLILFIVSFLPYFEHLPSGKTISSYQYYFIYFSFPFIWLAFLIGVGVRLETRISGKVFWPFLGLLFGFAAQACLLATPLWMISRVEFKKNHQVLYDKIKQHPEDAVVLSGNMSQGSSQELILRAGAWSFVPHPMMFTYASMAPTTELLERQLLAKLLLTGKVSDLAPIFSERGFPGYEKFYLQANPEISFWIDRLENCPARSFFLFHPVKSRKDLQVRRMTVPSSLLQQPESFAYFEPKYQKVFERVRSLEKRTFDEMIDYISHRFRLTHILITSKNLQVMERFRKNSNRLKPLIELSDGSALWMVVPPQTKK